MNPNGTHSTVINNGTTKTNGKWKGQRKKRIKKSPDN
jgi:hypothetical protein